MAADTWSGRDFRVGDWFVRPRQSKIEFGDVTVHVSPRAMAVLAYLAEADGAVVSRNDILDAVWPRMDVTQDALTQCIVELRKAFGDEARHSHVIETIPKLGLRLIPHVVADEQPENAAEEQRAFLVGESDRFSAANEKPKATSRSVKPAPTMAYANWRPAFAGIVFIAVVVAGAAFWNEVRQEPATPSSTGGIVEDRLSIAVLPFSNESSTDDGADFVADGIQDELISRLAKISAFSKVIAHRSVMDYRDTTKNIREIAQELGVGSVLEGRVQRAGNLVRMSLWLVDARTGELIWSESYTREPTVDNIFLIQNEVARSITTALEATLSPTELGQLDQSPTRNIEAYQYYVSGREYARGSDLLRDLPSAVQQFERAIEEDPGFALAHAHLAIENIHMYWTMDRTEARRDYALQTVRRALELQPDLPESHLAMAWYHYHGHLDYEAALRELSVAEQRMPGDADLFFARGAIYRRMGQWQEAIASLERAIEIDPRNTVLLRNQSASFMSLREYDRAERYLDRILEIAPDAVEAKIQKAWIPMQRDGDDRAAWLAVDGNPLLRPGQEAVNKWAIAIRARDYDRALVQLNEWDGDILYTGRTLYKLKDSAYGITYQLAGRPELAKRHFGIARSKLEQELLNSPEDPRYLLSLGEALAGLGDASAGIRLALRVIELMPTSRESSSGPSFQLDAVIRVLAPAGAVDAVVEQLDAYLAAPAPWSIEGILPDPRLDPVRDDPRFEALVNKYRRR